MSKKIWFQQVCCCKSSFIILLIYKNRDCLYDKYAMVLHEPGYTRSLYAKTARKKLNNKFCVKKNPWNFQS